MIAKHFPVTHPRKGDETYFRDKITDRFWPLPEFQKPEIEGMHKIHTIRKNYPLWQKRIAEVEAEKACLSLRQWEGRPYHSKQVEFLKLTKADGVGIQKLIFRDVWDAIAAQVFNPGESTCKCFSVFDKIEANDGLTEIDFRRWFWDKKENNYPLNEPFAIIHFTPFRYL